jgi:hypothetical protein
MMDLKKTDAPVGSVTYDRNEIDAATGVSTKRLCNNKTRRTFRINTDIRREVN